MKDLIILGNGMAGMTAALYAKRANLDFKIVGKDEFDFGQIGNAILVENFPCAASQSGFELAMNLHDQLEANDIKIEEHTVEFIFEDGEGFIVEYEDKTKDRAKSIIYALGASHRELEFESNVNDVTVHYCALCDGSLYKNKTVAVIGGGDVAFTQAEYLSKICSNVYVIMCDKNVTAAPATFDRVNKLENVKIVYNFPVTDINKQENGMYILGSKNIRGFYLVNGIFIAIGMIPNVNPVHFLPLKVTPMGIVATENGDTGYEGFFVAGDIRMKNVRQGLTAAADGANAVNSVINYLKGK